MHRARGVDLGQYRRSYVLRRLASRARALDLPDLEAYAGYVESQSKEVDELLRTLSVQVTQFFRNPSFFRFLERRVLPDLLDGRTGPAPSIWSAGCATGEEAYSIAMLLASRGAPAEATILATDIDRAAMLTARSAVYPRSRARAVPPALAARYLAPVSPTHVRVAPDAARHVSFRAADLFRARRRPMFDLIVCRNVLIYVEPERQRELLARFVCALRPGGFLALGRAERLTGPAREKLQTLSATERVYRRS